MPHKDPERRRASWREWYHRTKNSPEQAKSKNARRRRRIEQRKILGARVEALKVERGCLGCGERHPAVLQFHHARGTKEFEISRAVSDCFPWPRIEAEIEKCDVLCANCHRKRHPRPEPKSVPPRLRRSVFDEENER